MRIYHFTLLFIAVAFPMITAVFMETENRHALIEREMDVEDMIRAATYAGAARLTGDEHGERARQEACEAFFKSLYASSDAVGDPARRESISRDVPLLLIKTDGEFYANRLVCVRDDEGGPAFEREWCRASDYLAAHGESEASLQGWLKECVKGAEQGALKMGVACRFNLPLHGGSELLRKLDGEMFAAFYQKAENDDMGERELTVATADYQSKPGRLFPVTEDGTGKRLYHRPGCPEAVDGIIACCYTKKECACHNAYPCRLCFGD